MDSVFGMFFWTLAIIAFGACIGAGLRGRPGRLFGLTILKIGLAGLFVMLLFVDSFPHNEIILWLLLMLMAGAVSAVRAGWQRVLWGRMMSRRGRIDGNTEARLSPLFFRPFPTCSLRRGRPRSLLFPFRQEGRPGVGYRQDIPFFSNDSGQVLFPIRFGITGALLWEPETLRTGIRWGESLERMGNWRVRVKPFF